MSSKEIPQDVGLSAMYRDCQNHILTEGNLMRYLVENIILPDDHHINKFRIYNPNLPTVQFTPFDQQDVEYHGTLYSGIKRIGETNNYIYHNIAKPNAPPSSPYYYRQTSMRYESAGQKLSWSMPAIDTQLKSYIPSGFENYISYLSFQTSNHGGPSWNAVRYDHHGIQCSPIEPITYSEGLDEIFLEAARYGILPGFINSNAKFNTTHFKEYNPFPIQNTDKINPN